MLAGHWAVWGLKELKNRAKKIDAFLGNMNWIFNVALQQKSGFMHFVKHCSKKEVCAVVCLLLACLSASVLQAQHHQERFVPPGLYAGLGIDSVRVYPEDTCEGKHPMKLFVYDRGGNETEEWDYRQGVHIRRQFDAEGRPHRVVNATIRQDGPGSFREIEHFVYYGRLPYPERIITSDASGRELFRREFTYQYGQVRTMQMLRPGETALTYHYTRSSDGRLRGVMVAENAGRYLETWAYRYDDSGRMAGFVAAPAAVNRRAPDIQEFERNSKGQLTEHRVFNERGVLSQRYRFAYTSEGLLQREEWNIEQHGNTGVRRSAFCYRYHYKQSGWQ